MRDEIQNTQKTLVVDIENTFVTLIDFKTP